MNKTLIITAGIALICVVLGVWIYLLFFGAPQNTDDVLYDLGIKIEPVERTVSTSPETSVDISTDALRQITTRPVAGFVSIASSSLRYIVYAEKGTGHVYKIDTNTGEEVRLSGTTIPQTVHVVFSAMGTSAVFISEHNYVHTVSIGRVPTSPETGGNITLSELPQNAENSNFLTETKLQYTTSDALSTTGFVYDFETQTATEVFTAPFSEIGVAWGIDTYFIFNKPAATLQGGLYTIENTSLQRVTAPQYGLDALVNDNGTAYVTTYIDNTADAYVSLFRTIDDANIQSLSIPVIPDKCDFDALDPTLLWCAGPFEHISRTQLDDWRQGAYVFDDILWKINLETNEAEVLSLTQEEAGRRIDVQHMVYDPFAKHLVFSNRVDNTLWLYDTTY